MSLNVIILNTFRPFVCLKSGMANGGGVSQNPPVIEKIGKAGPPSAAAIF